MANQWSTPPDNCCAAAVPNDTLYGQSFGSSNGCQALFCPCFVYSQIIRKTNKNKIGGALCGSCPNG